MLTRMLSPGGGVGRSVCALAGLMLAVTGGCRSNGVGTDLGSDGQSPGRSEDGLRRRAQQLWAARQADDCKTVFGLLDPEERQGAKVEEYCAWYLKEEPFRVDEFEIAAVQTEGTMGWVEVRGNMRMRRFPNLPPRAAQPWEKWRLVEGTWYPVPRRVLEAYPTAPPERDLDAERRLRERAGRVWQARYDRDWPALYALTDPRDHAAVPQADFAQACDLLEYVDHHIEWVEVVGNRGTVRVVSGQRVRDPSLTKLQVERKTSNESWIQHEGEWYLDLKR